ncbi:MAG: cobyric acid synthase [Thermodesulfobacteriota bacterium]
MRRTPIMILGCTSDAGKSFLVTALCRHLANRGVRVAPFKAQNMSNNAAVTPDGGEIGRAQHLQALAARVVPDVRMNPILLKPSADTASQVVVLGRWDERATRMPWLERRDYLWPIVRDALHELLAEHEQLVLEGAGSPAEVNLRASDVVNMAVALECEADVYLVSDIDRGGSFAHLLGTWMCLTDDERRRVRGFVLNRFRGDPALLGDAPAWLERRTGVPVVATIPYLRHALPEEDAFHHRRRFVPGASNLALVLYPYASNLDEFDPLFHEDGVNVVPVERATPLDAFDAVLLPGSKNTAASLRHLRATGLAREIVSVARRGTRVLGVCGGMQLLGIEVLDPQGVEDGDAEGLGLLDLRTRLAPRKTTRWTEIAWRGARLRGYEIHHGDTEPIGPRASPWLEGGLGWEHGNVAGVYLHGLFEDTRFRQEFLERLGWRGRAGDWAARLDGEIERVARLIEESGWPI